MHLRSTCVLFNVACAHAQNQSCTWCNFNVSSFVREVREYRACVKNWRSDGRSELLRTMGRISLETRRRVVLLRSYPAAAIQRRLLEEGIKMSRFSIYKLLKKYDSTGTIADRPRQKSTPILSEEQLEFISKCLEQNDELTAAKLRDKLTERWPTLTISARSVRRARWKLGWRASRPKYCQLIREANKLKRLQWCQERVANNEQFDDVIFTDECSVQLDHHGRLCFRKKDEPRKMKPKPKHPLKVHVWGA